MTETAGMSMVRDSGQSGYEKSPLRLVTGDSLRVGGIELTRHGLALCGFAPGARLLDMGCGPGATLALLRELGYCGIGADVSFAFLREITTRIPESRCIGADMRRLPLREACLDGIICECVLSQAEDKASVLREARRVLVPGGRLLLSDLAMRGAPPPVKTAAFAREKAQTAAGASRPSVTEAETVTSLLAGAPSSLAGPPCVRGAISFDRLAGLLRQAGFNILFSEDRTRLLRELAANIVWKFGSLAAFTDLWHPAWRAGTKNSAPVRAAGNSTGGAPAGKLGYLLVIAEKK